MYSTEDYTSTVFSISKHTHTIQLKGNMDEILKKEKLARKSSHTKFTCIPESISTEI